MSNKKKQKIKYIDDGSTIADMSAFGKPSHQNGAVGTSSWREKIRTYFESVKLMFFPMLITLGLIALSFGLLYLLLSLA